MLFTLVYENNLEDYQDEILNYIRKLKKIANVHPRLMHVAIFSVFRTERKRLSILFPEIYRQFGNHLEISKMSNDDKEYIMNTFINAVEKIGKEQINKCIHDIFLIIITHFRTERKRLSILFPEIYRQFGNHLEISKMSNDDKEYIMNTFINAVEKIGKEQINAIQKNT